MSNQGQEQVIAQLSLVRGPGQVARVYVLVQGHATWSVLPQSAVPDLGDKMHEAFSHQLNVAGIDKVCVYVCAPVWKSIETKHRCSLPRGHFNARRSCMMQHSDD